MAESAQDAVFDKILAIVGDDGKFQNRSVEIRRKLAHLSNR